MRPPIITTWSTACALALTAATLACALWARAAPAMSAGQEIDALLERLATSACTFERNGQWHGGREASEHLARKLHAADPGKGDRTEDFIAQAATRSSVSGRAYTVRCPGEPDRPAAAWLGHQLEQLRSGR